MSCIHLIAPQGTPEWLSNRCGSITGSMFSEARNIVGGLTDQQSKLVSLVRSGMSKKDAAIAAGYKTTPNFSAFDDAVAGKKIGEPSNAAKAYAFKLAVERISGQLLDVPQFETWQMRQGTEMEPEARLKYEEKSGLLVEQTGLALTEDRVFGSSVDGLVDDDGIIEIKCFVDPTKLQSILIDGNIGEVMDQVQGSLWITGRKWADFVLYCRQLECINRDLTIIRVNRDDDYITELEADLLRFNEYVKQIQSKLFK